MRAFLYFALGIMCLEAGTATVTLLALKGSYGWTLLIGGFCVPALMANWIIGIQRFRERR